MRIQTFSIVVGTKACNAKCPFCVSRMTGFEPVVGKGHDIAEGNFTKACRLAQIGGTTTVLLTGKGEPTLYPSEVTQYLRLLEPWQFPLIELQTNGTKLTGNSALFDWRDSGLNTIALSAVSDRLDENRAIYGDAYRDLSGTIRNLKTIGYTVRLCIMLVQGAIDSLDRLDDLIRFCKSEGVDQLTVRPIRKPTITKDDRVSLFVEERGLPKHTEESMTGYIRSAGTRLLSLMHGAEVFDINGQNICLADCLTNEPDSDDIRTLIFYSDGRLCYDWQYDGAVILGGKNGH